MAASSNGGKNQRDVARLLDWESQSELNRWLLLLAGGTMAYRRIVTGGIVIVLALVIGWGINRDPLLLASALVTGILTGLFLLIVSRR